jgi:hypothetical protein
MKRMHVHVSVANLEDSVRFYSTLFASQPTVQKPDYAKWMLDDPRVNFAVSQRGHTTGIEHLGIQVENTEELAEVYGRLSKAGRPVIEEQAATCCYAKSDKQWVDDPQGIAWETFLTHGESAVYGNERPAEGSAAACCVPLETVAAGAACCEPSVKAAATKGCCG